jgi:peptidoglycan/xylan/chitin deacetylase (PgdA/CDA1 family)
MPTRSGLLALRRCLGFPPRALLGTITHVATREPIAALTFDDGPHPVYTPRLLEILASHGARATFFMVGQAAQAHPELVRRVAQAGHAIGNHSWDHPAFPRLSERERQAQLRRWEQAVAPFGHRLFRPPYGEQSLRSRLSLLRRRYCVVAWNVEVGDWWDPDAQRLADQLVERLTPGSVIVLHDALVRHPSRQREPMLRRRPLADRGAMLAAVDQFLARVGSRMAFVTLPELLRRGRPQRANWYRVTRPAGAVEAAGAW